MDKYTFANNLYELRTSQNMTQKQLAKYLGVSNKAVSKWETGETMPRVKMLQAIAECLGVSYSDLLSQNPTEHKRTPAELYYEKRLENKKLAFQSNMILCAFCPAIVLLLRAVVLFVSFTSAPQYAYTFFSTIFFAILYYYNYKKTKDAFIKIENNSTHNIRNLLVIPIIFTVLLAFDSLICAQAFKVFLIFCAPFYVLFLIYSVTIYIIKHKVSTSTFYALYMSFQTILSVYIALIFALIPVKYIYFTITLMNAHSLMTFSFVSFKDILEYEQMRCDKDVVASLDSFSWKFSTIFAIILLIFSSVTLLYFFLR